MSPTLSISAALPFHFPSTPSLHNWEQLAERACQMIAAEQLECALAIQVKALHMARCLLHSPQLGFQPDGCMAAWVVSHHQIADLLARRDQLPLAIDYLCDAHAGLLDLLEAQQHAEAVQSAIWRHLRQTHITLLHWQRQHGPWSQIEAALQSSAALGVNPAAPSLAPADLRPQPLLY